MGVDHPGLQMSMADLIRTIRRVARQTIQNASIGRAGIRVYDGGWIRIEDGGLSVTGTATVSGTMNVTGTLTGNGTLDWLGPVNLKGAQSVTGPTTFTGKMTVNGAWELNGNGSIDGTVTIAGAATLASTLTVTGQIKAGDVTVTPSGGGRVQAGNVFMDGGGSYGGRVWSSGSVLQLGASGSVAIGAPFLIVDNISTTGAVDVFGDLDVGGAKNFRMPHPTKPDHWLRHGSTESPVSGTEYTGRATIGPDGTALAELPEYFEALNKPHRRTVHVTPIGRPFMAGADDVVDGTVTLYGEPGREVFWLVKAERYGGDFILEEPIPPAPFSEN